MSILVTTYCERQEIAWAIEPLNTASNLAFFVLAVKLFHQGSDKPGNNLYASGWSWSLNPTKLLALLALATGIGSASYHAYPGYITLALDLIPILSISAFLCWLLLTNVCALGRRWALIFVILLPVSTLSMSSFNHLANGSLFYLPLWTYICGLLLYCCTILERHSPLYRQSIQLGFLLLLAFTLALLSRTIDIRICPSIPLGTHFLWHIFAAFSIYFAYKLYCLHDASSDF